MEITTTRPVAPVAECPLPSNLLYANFASATLAGTRHRQPELSRDPRLRDVVRRCVAQIGHAVQASWRALIARTRRAPKLLVIQETATLGDRRFVAVVQFERQRFLIGSSPSSVTLLAPLPDAGHAAIPTGSVSGASGSVDGADL